MSYIRFGAVFAAAFIFLFMGVMLLLQRKQGERSRVILAGMMFLSVANYTDLILDIYRTPLSLDVIPVHLLLLGIFVTAIYIMYPIEVIFPGWLTWRRLLKIYVPLTAGLVFIYKVPQWIGVQHAHCSTLPQMYAHPLAAEVVLCVVLALFIFVPVVTLWFVPYTRKYNNTDHKWMRGYTIVAIINAVSYLIVSAIDSNTICLLYYLISVLCSFYFFYQEMTVRLICGKTEESQQLSVSSPHEANAEPEQPALNNTLQGKVLFVAIEEYVDREQVWRDPDLSMTMLVDKLRTNRRAMLAALHQGGYDGYPSYINNKRISDYINLVQSGKSDSYIDAFYDVGFRSKSTALRNFKEITRTIPSEYFRK